MTSASLSALEVVTAIQPLSIEKTRSLVFHLGVHSTALDDIEGQFNGDTRKEKFVEKWLNLDTKASWGRLVLALKQIDMNVLAAGIMFQRLILRPPPLKFIQHEPALLSRRKSLLWRRVNRPPQHLIMLHL